MGMGLQDSLKMDRGSEIQVVGWHKVLDCCIMWFALSSLPFSNKKEVLELVRCPLP